MPTADQTVAEILAQQGQGLTPLAARLAAFREEVTATGEKLNALLGLLNDPRYQRHQQRVAGMAQQYQLLALKARNVAAAQALADGSAVRHLRNVQKLNDEYSRLRRETELVARYGERVGRFLARPGVAAAGR